MRYINSLLTFPIFIKKIASIIKDVKSNRQWQAMVDHAEPFINRATRGFQKLFNEQEAQILEKLEHYKSANSIINAYKEHQKRIEDLGQDLTDHTAEFGYGSDNIVKLLLDNMNKERRFKAEINADPFLDWSEWEVKFQEFDQLLLPSVFASWGPEILNQIVIGIDFNADNQLIHEFIKEHSYKMAINVNETTKKKIRDIFDTAVDNGESVPQIMKRIREEFDNIGKVRANMIARSEIIRAHNASADAAYIQSGVVEFKQWWAARDERICPFCLEMHGKTIAVGGEYFKLGDTLTVMVDNKPKTLKLNYSDIKYPPLHVKCRCVLLPVV